MSEEFYANDVVKLTQDLVKIPSHKFIENRESEVAEFIYNYCKKSGLEVEYQQVEGLRRNVIAKLKGKGTGKNLIFNGHIDTVPPYEMEFDPFCAEIKDGYLLGRGCNDMKGAVACMITAMLSIKNKGIQLGGDIILTAAVGEEEKSDGTEFVVKSGIRADGAIVGEPANYGYALGHRGLEWLEIRIEGKIAHGGIPELGINAISKAAKLIRRIEEQLMPKLKERQNEWMGPSVMNFGLIKGGTQPSSVADSCIIQIDRRYLPGENVEGVIKEYQDIIDEIKAEDKEFKAEIIRMDSNLMDEFDHAPLIAQPDSDIAKTVYNVLKEFVNKEPNIEKRRGWTDAGVLSTYGKIPTVVTGPGDLKYSHAKNEKIPVVDLTNYVEIYTKIAEEFCK
ncbi:MAG: acetylornithine deacetylase or succinyl-diaminopimelate desuccinylase [Sedimentibacter sp.]|jgi:acetylornithine deacetylase/succinyl-diaminopimelate desuccinylase|nr:acetylornithine deacetylase or succinyl-diaminopimelate desuccinylase [Sedimentibacter sp.]